MYFLRAACLLGVRQYMPVLHMLVPGFISITWSHAWWSGRWWDACSLKTLEYLWYWAGICVMDVALGLFSIAILVLVVDFDLMASSSYLVKLWLYRNDSRASWLKVVSWYWGSSSSGWSALIDIVCVCGFLDVITRGFLDKVQVLGHLENAICGRAQFTLGLCAWSQSVPNMMSWSPRVVT